MPRPLADRLEPEPAAPPPDHPYFDCLSACLGSALFAAVATAILDAFAATGAAKGLGSGDTARVAVVCLALYGVLAVVIGVIQGVVAGAIRATYPEGATVALWRRLSDDPVVDRRAAGGILAGLGAGALYALTIAVLSKPLVIAPARKTVGALLLGGVATALLPLFALFAWPFYRLTRHIVKIIPRLGPVPATIVMLVFAGGVAASVGTLYVVTRLEWRALPLGAPIAFAAFFLAQAVWLALWYGPLDTVRKRMPGSILLTGAVALALAMPVIAFGGKSPSDKAVQTILTTRGARPLALAARRFVDRDHDGYSAFLGGPDCNDRDQSVHPNADEVAGDGIDQNCNGADAPLQTDDGGALTPPPPPDSKTATFKWEKNVVIIAVDTLRADRVGAGYQLHGKAVAPRMDELAAKGIHFTRAYAQAPRTPTSFPSIFSSRYPTHVKWEGSMTAPYPKISADATTIFEALQAAGWTTVGESSHFYFTPERGITQGFTKYSNAGALDISGSNTDNAGPRIAPRVDARLKELAAGKQKFVLFAHLFEPHSTYVEHPGCEITASGNLPRWIEKYDCEVNSVDEYVGAIVDSIKAAGLADDTIVVLVSDHGEGMADHRYAGQELRWHGMSLYDDVLRVPMVVYIPGVAARKVDDPVMLIDLGPTLLDLVGAAIPKEFEGRSLKALLFGEPLAPRAVHAELVPYPSFDHPMKALVDPDGKKVIWFEGDGAWEVYDLTKDPKEQNDLASSDPELAKKMKGEMGAWIDSQPK